MPDYLPTKVSEEVCQNSRNFDVVLSGVSPPFSDLLSGDSGVLRCRVLIEGFCLSVVSSYEVSYSIKSFMSYQILLSLSIPDSI